MSYIQQSNPNSPLPDSIRSPRGFIDASASSRSKILHTQENRVNSTCLCQYNKITCHQSIMPHNHNQMPNSIIIWITCKQVSSKNKFAQCAQERDVTVYIVLKISELQLQSPTNSTIRNPIRRT
jgi:hypothetical protein